MCHGKEAKVEGKNFPFKFQCILGFKKIGGYFDPLRLVSGVIFKYVGSFLISCTS